MVGRLTAIYIFVNHTNIRRLMDGTCVLASRFLYLPLRAFCMRWCGQHRVALLEEVASSSQVSGLVFQPPRSGDLSTPGNDRPSLRSRFLERVLDRPYLQARAARMAAHMAAQAAQVKVFLVMHRSPWCLFKIP